VIVSTANEGVSNAVELHLSTLLGLFRDQQPAKGPQIQKMIAVLAAVLQVAKEKKKWPTWLKSDTELVYQMLGVPERPEVMNAAYKRNLHQTNRVLSRVFKYLKSKAGLKVSSMPEINFFPRANQAVSQDDEAFELLDYFHGILLYMQSHKPNIATKNLVLRADLMLILIAFDGVVRKDADFRLAYIQKKHVCIDSESRVELPLGKRVGYKDLARVYPIGDLSQLYFKVLLNRVKRVQEKWYLFPREWRKRSKARVSRRIDLDHRLRELWRIVHPDKPVPSAWNTHMWIRLAHMSLSQLGVPYIVIASLSGKLRTAHLKRAVDLQSGEITNSELPPPRPEESHGEAVYDVKHDLMAEMLFLNVRGILLGYGYKENHMAPKKAAAADIEKLMAAYSDFLGTTPNVKLLLEWVVWMLRGQKYRKNRISTFLSYISVMPCRLLPIMGARKISDMSMEEWIELASFLASDMDYAASSRRQTMTHLKSLCEFLVCDHKGDPQIDWDNYAFRVSRGIPEAYVVKPSEIDQLLSRLSTFDHVWIVIVLAFYAGLRCEEISALKPSDLLDDYKLQIGWSKRQTSRRSVPIGWLVPEPYRTQLIKVIKHKGEVGDSRIVSEPDGEPIGPNTLGKRIARVLVKNNLSVSGMHSLRHGFASWAFFRYFMLIDPDFYSRAMEGEVCDGLDPSNPMFSKAALKMLARVFGGAQWEHAWSTMQCCPGGPADAAIIAMLLGHTNRFTPTENYFNSMEWIVRHYLNQRYSRVAGLAAARGSFI